MTSIQQTGKLRRQELTDFSGTCKSLLLLALVISNLFLLWTQHVRIMPLNPNHYFLSPQEGTATNLNELREFYEHHVEESVKFNNWDMGCSDLSLMAPYIRGVMDRQMNRKRQLLFDIGANTGQDADTIMGVFHKITGMCGGYATPFTVISVEPSPQVFCELEDLVQKQGWKPPQQEIIRLNIGMSNTTGLLQFKDPGNEGGQLVGSSDVALEKMTPEAFQNVSTCGFQGNHTVDWKRVSMVPTYTMDLLMASLESSDIEVPVSPKDDIMLLKIDTESHDLFVLQGAKSLLANKRITFVLFEVWNNSYLRQITEFMDAHDYLCFLIFPNMLVPVHLEDWWYENLNQDVKRGWWGNGFCGIRNSDSLSMLYRMFHSDNEFLLNAHDTVMKRNTNKDV